MGAGWDEERARAFPVGLTVSQRVRELADAIGTARHETERARRDLDAVAQGRSGRQKDLERLRRGSGGAEAPTRDILTEQFTAIRRLRVHLAELIALRSRIQAEEQLHTDREQTLAQTVTQTTLPSWLGRSALVVALAGLTAAAWRLSVADAVNGFALVFFALAVLVAIGAVRRRDAATAASMARRSHDLRTSLRHIETLLGKAMSRFHRYSVHNVCRLCRARHNRHHADSRIMPTVFRHESGGGGDRAFPKDAVGIIRGVRETRGVGRMVGSDPASRPSASFAPAPAL